MVSVDLKSLIGRLNDQCRQALEAAAGLCLSRTNYNLEVEHWLLKLLDIKGTDLAVILRQYDVDAAQLQRDLTRAIDRFKAGNARPPVLSPETVDLARDAWLVASVQFGAGATRSGHLLCSLLMDETRSRVAKETSPQFAKIPAERLLKELPTLIANTDEAAAAAEVRPTAPGAAPAAPGQPGKGSPALNQYTVDLTAQAKAKKMDPVLGRDVEVRQIIDILMRRRQNNPILTGEAGVGKTAVVEGFAQRIAANDVPPPLRGVVLRSLDMGLLQAGASVRGEFENRLRSVIDEVKASPQPVILFIDEAHTLVGAGGGSGAGDAANLLKPALARGELRTIAATTWAEYKKYFEKDPALTRRFQVVKVDEPTEASAENMMRGLVGKLEGHHGVRVLDEAVSASVRMSHRYMSGRHLPDKSVSVLDTACARVAIARDDVPPQVEGLRRQLDALGRQIESLQREHDVGADREQDIKSLHEQRRQTQADLEKLEARWKQEAALVTKANELRTKLEGGPTDKAKPGKPAEKPAPPLTEQERAALRGEFEKVTRELATLQGDRPLMPAFVDRNAIAAVISGWTGIPVGRMVSDEINTVLKLQDRLGEQVVGQGHALEIISKSIRTSRADLTDPSKPIGVFFMAGPSGVGKTETALALADLLYGGEQNLTVINMSEFKEEHKVSLLMGSPPGYVGYGEGGVLTEAVRRKPYCVLLLDEMEKAHPGVQDIFYQVFDKGSLRDGEGRDIDFKNTVIMMTSNAASDLIMKLCGDPETRPDAEGLAQAVYPELLKNFKPAFLGRCTVVPYFPLADDVMRKIVRLKLNKIVRRVRENHKAEMSFGDEVVESIVSRCTEVESGARNIDHIVSRTLLPELSTEFLSRMTGGVPIEKVRVSVKPDGAFGYDFNTTA